MFKKLFVILLFISALIGDDATYDDSNFNDMVFKSFLIAKSTKSYNEAQTFAKKIALDLNINLDLRGLSSHPKNFLTLSKEQCENDNFEYPCYVARGRYDDGEYISIEHTDYYNEFTKGYYIVVVASGEDVSQSLAKVKEKVKDAYVKKAQIYMGCTH